MNFISRNFTRKKEIIIHDNSISKITLKKKKKVTSEGEEALFIRDVPQADGFVVIIIINK